MKKIVDSKLNYGEKNMKFEENKGISLIALIVTIVVLMLLATVTIGSLTGNHSLIKSAQNARNETIEGGQVEKNSLLDIKNAIDGKVEMYNLIP